MINSFFRRMFEKSDRYSVKELDRLGGLTSHQMKDIRGRVPILVIDDEQDEMYKKKLYENGYHGVSSQRASPSDDEIRKYSILIVDVVGIREDVQSNGLMFAKRIKKMYPLKEVIVMSGQPKYVKQLNNNEIQDGVWSFRKGTSFDLLLDRLDKCIKHLYDPSLAWRTIRMELLGRDLESKMDMVIHLVAEWESLFVKKVLGQDSDSKSINIDWIELFHDGVILAAEVRSLLDCIAPLMTVS